MESPSESGLGGKIRYIADVIWIVFEKVSQSNSRFNALETLEVTVHSVKMPVGFGCPIKSMRIPLSITARLERSVVKVKAKENFLAHALIIAITRLDNDANYKSRRQGRKVRPGVQTLREEAGIDLTRGPRIPELNRFKENFRDSNIEI